MSRWRLERRIGRRVFPLDDRFGFASSTWSSDGPPAGCLSSLAGVLVFMPSRAPWAGSHRAAAADFAADFRASCADNFDSRYSRQRHASFALRACAARRPASRRALGEVSVIKNWLICAAVALPALAFPSASQAYQLAISQYGRVTATLPWAVAI